MSEYRIAVLKGLRADRVDGCWQSAVLAIPGLFEPALVARCELDLKRTPEERAGES